MKIAGVVWKQVAFAVVIFCATRATSSAAAIERTAVEQTAADTYSTEFDGLP
jgi:hypothetical protein